MKQQLRRIALSTALWAIIPTAFALDLPVKRINGKEYYQYAVKRNESLLDIASKFGLTRDEILRFNPSAVDGLRSGMSLYFPVNEFASKFKTDNTKSATSESNTIRYKVQSGETLFGISYRFKTTPEAIIALNPRADKGIRAGEELLIPTESNATAENTDSAIEDESVSVNAVTEQPSDVAVEENVIEQETPETVAESMPVQVKANKSTIAILMPFMLDGSDNDKHVKASNDFIRGFLLGAKSMSDYAVPVDLRIYDTKASSDEIHAILRKPELDSVSVVIAPEDILSLPVVNADATKKGAYVLNLFAAQDTSYANNSKAMQSYIPASRMYEKAANALMSDFAGYTPVFLISKGGKSEKLPFTNYLRDRYLEAGITPEEVMYDGSLSIDNLASIDRTGRYVFIPASGSLSEFNKFAKTLVMLREEMVMPTDVALFGYPDWTAFLGDAQDRLHDLNASIYSRFFNETTSADTEHFNSEFMLTYGAKPLEQVPSQALLGYDSARYLLDNLKRNNGVFTPFDGSVFRGLQTTFMFGNEAASGPVNDALYIIRYLPAKQVEIKVI